ncbi:MAG: hypothetical protein BZ134_00365 [Methanosphaera sp. SHI1033]|nr:MAG: hypothetical protein BZ134_00365 [Methanosphaera sp. SHI1033]
MPSYHHLLEADFAQIEHINQIIHNNIIHDSWECFDTALLLEQHPQYGVYNSTNPRSSKITKNVTDVRYNSFLVNIDTISYADYKAYMYTFEVRNVLWDGAYKITRSKNNNNDPDITHKGVVQVTKGTDDNTINIYVEGEGCEDIRVCFHMSQAGTGRNISTSSIIIQNDDLYEEQYDKSFNHTGKVVDALGKPLSNVELTLSACTSEGLDTEGGIPSCVGKMSDKNGNYTLTYGATDRPSLYYAKITAKQGLFEVSKVIQVNKIQENKRGVIWGDEKQYNGVWKGSIKEFKIQIAVYNKYNIHDPDLDKQLIGSRVNVTMINPHTKEQVSQTCTIQQDGYINPRVNYRRYYEDKSILRVSLEANTAFGTVISEREVTHEYAKATSWVNLNTMISSDDGPDWVMVPASTISPNEDIQTITIARDITICGTKGTNACKIDGLDKYNPFVVSNSSPATDNRIKFRLIGVSIYNCTPAILVNEGSALYIDKCVFRGNSHPAHHHKGCCIYTRNTDFTNKQHNLFQTHVTNSTFYNNVGNEIQSIGESHLDHNLFRTDNSKYLMQPEPKVVSVVAGEVTYKYNKSHIKITDKEMTSNHSYAKALAYVYRGAKFNGRGPNQLYGDMTLPLYDDPWYNQAYTYAIYYYPYLHRPTKIVCSPRKGFERKSTGHGSSSKRWIFYDGYYFIRREQGKGNKNDPWTSTELAIPVNTGIYDSYYDEFTQKEYDPRLSSYKTRKETKFMPDTW